MTRKLLPYEHQLIEELGVSKEDYLGFLQVQFDYTTTPEQRLEKPQAEVVATVLVIVGTLLQVVGALLAKPPSEGKRQPREQTFAPRIGFNSAQELAKYGDPINLVYTNTSNNPNGGVRVATSLVWSAVESFGSSQYMQMMLVLGGGAINTIDPERISFGQTPIRQFQAQSAWLYYNKNGLQNLKFNNVIKGDTNDPSRRASTATDLVYRVNPSNGIRQEGFSQVFSPTSLTRCGIFSPIPINVVVVDRLSSGKPKAAPIGITVDSTFLSAYWPETGARPIVPINTQLIITFAKAEFSESAKTDVIQTASEKRRTLFEGLDLASTYMLGSAKFRLSSISNPDLEEGDSVVTFVCFESGHVCKEKYSLLNYRDEEDSVTADQIETLQQEIASLQTQLTANPPIYKSKEIEAELNAKLAEIEAKTNAYIDFTDNAIKLKTISDITPNSFYPIEINNLINSIDANEERMEGLRDGSLSKGSGFDSKRDEIKYLRRVVKQQTKDLQQALFNFFDEEVNLNSPTSKARQKALQTEINNLNIQAVQIASDTIIRDLDAEVARNAEWQQSIDTKQAELDVLEAEGAADNYYHTKCLVKIEEAAYEAITPCNIIDFALRARVFRRISNRSRRYGEKKEEQFKNSDNGSKLRSSFFRVRYRQVGQSWKMVNRIFVLRRGNDIDNYVSLKFRTNQSSSKWQFQFIPVAETAAEMLTRGVVNFAYIENEGSTQSIDNGDGTSFFFIGTLKDRVLDLPPLNNSPAETDEWSLFSTRSDTQIQFSFDNGPEIEIKAVTEQSIEALSSYPKLYDNLSLLGFNAYSGQGVQDLRSVSAFVTQGKSCNTLTSASTYALSSSSSSYAPDIFLDTIVDTVDGIGRFAKIHGVDLNQLWLSKQFCITNGLFMDGVIAEPSSWRQFWAEVAPYSLLELGRIGGKETLIPAVPCNSSGAILNTVPISALFNAGNILEDSYKEEFLDYGTNVQDLIATVIYRDTEQEGFFPRNRSVDIKLADIADESLTIRQTFDISQFVTNRSQAIIFGKLLCNQRRHIRKAIEFRTFPTDSVLSPGAYIYTDIGQLQWNNIYSGSVEAGGALNTPIAQILNGTYNILLWKSGQSSVVSLNSISIVNNTSSSLAAYDGWLFVLGTNVKNKRVFKITEVQMDEEGEVTVKALEHPCDENGNSLITAGLTNPSSTLFVIR